MTKTKKPRFKRLPKGPNGGVQLLLIQSVENLGRHGDIVEVKLCGLADVDLFLIGGVCQKLDRS